MQRTRDGSDLIYMNNPLKSYPPYSLRYILMFTYLLIILVITQRKRETETDNTNSVEILGESHVIFTSKNTGNNHYWSQDTSRHNTKCFVSFVMIYRSQNTVSQFIFILLKHLFPTRLLVFYIRPPLSHRFVFYFLMDNVTLNLKNIFHFLK